MKNKYKTPEQLLIDTIQNTFNYRYEDAEKYAKYLKDTCLRLYYRDKNKMEDKPC